MKRSKRNTILGISILAGFIAFWSILFYFYTPQDLVSDIGITHTYWVVFFVALLGAFSSFTTVSIYPLLVILAASGLGPIGLGAVAGLGLTIGDLIFFYFGTGISGLTSERFKEKLHNTLDKIQENHRWVMPLTIYVYVGLTPFPNNILTGYLALSEYPWIRLVIPLALGNITLPIVAALLAKDILRMFF